MIGIYKITNKVNSKVYIGQSKNVEFRWATHKSQLRHNRHENPYLQAAWNKDGEKNFVFELLEELTEVDNSILDSREIYWISQYNSNQSLYGYNLTAGGGGHSGRPLTETEKKHLSSLTTKGTIVQVNIITGETTRWSSASAAARELQIPVSGIRQCVRSDGDQLQCNGSLWFLAENYPEDFDLEKFKKEHTSSFRQRVFEYDLYGNLIKVWGNTAEMRQILPRSKYKNVFRVLNHSVKAINGRIYLYEDDHSVVLSEDYLLQCRIDSYLYKIKQIDKTNNVVKIWEQAELRNSSYRYDTIRATCTKNYRHPSDNGMKYSTYDYVWEYA